MDDLTCPICGSSEVIVYHYTEGTCNRCGYTFNVPSKREGNSRKILS